MLSSERNLPTTIFADDIEQMGDRLYQAQAEKSIKAVFGYYLGREIELAGIKEDKSGEFVTKKLPIYADALRRGEKIVREKISSGEFSIELYGGRAKLAYSWDGPVLNWKTVPDIADLFERAKFLRELKNSKEEVAGRTLFWADPLLVEASLDEGFLQQRKAFSTLDNLHSAIVETEKSNQLLLSSIGYPKTDFEEVKKLYTQLKRKAGNEDLFETFVATYLVNQELPKFLPETRKAVEQIDRLAEFLQNITYGKGEKFRNTWVVEILTNNNFDKSIDFLRYPKTKLARVQKVTDFAMRLSEGPEFELKCALFAQEAIDDAKAKLLPLFEVNRIPGDLTINYLWHLTFEYLRSVPKNRFLISSEPDPVLNHKFFLDQFINTPQAPLRPRREPEVFTPTQLVNELFDKQHRLFRKTAFRQLSPEQRREVVYAAVARIKEMNQDPRNDVDFLLKSFGISYTPSKRVFVKRYMSSAKPGDVWIKDCAKDLLSAFANKVESGNMRLADAFVNIIEEKTIPYFLERTDLPYSSISFARIVDGVFKDYAYKTRTYEDALSKLRRVFATRKILKDVGIIIGTRFFLELRSFIESRSQDVGNQIYYNEKTGAARSAAELKRFYNEIRDLGDLTNEILKIELDFAEKGLPAGMNTDAASTIAQILVRSAAALS